MKNSTGDVFSTVDEKDGFLRKRTYKQGKDSRGKGVSRSPSGPAGPVWEGAEYARVTPGTYSAVAVRIQGPEQVRRYRRWSLLVEFELLGESDIRVCCFLNLGNDPLRLKVGRQSKYFKAWTIANGEMPRKGQRMNPDVFMDGQVFQVEVKDAGVDSEGERKADSEVYSRVTKILSAVRSHQESLNQESTIINPLIQQFKQSSWPAGNGRLELHFISIVKIRLRRAKVAHTHSKPKGRRVRSPFRPWQELPILFRRIVLSTCQNVPSRAITSIQ